MERILQKYRKSLIVMGKVAEILILGELFLAVWGRYYEEASFFYLGNFVVIGFYFIVLLIFFLTYGATKVGVSRLGELIFSGFLAILFTNAIQYIQLVLIARQLLDIYPMLLLICVQLVAIILISSLLNKLYFIIYTRRKVALIYGDDAEGERFARKVSMVKDKYSIARVYSDTEAAANLDQIMEEYSCFMMIDVELNLREKIFSKCFDSDKRVYIVPNTTDIMVKNSVSSTIFDTPMLLFKNRGAGTEQAIIKRIFDFIFALIGLIVSSPIMLLIAIAIKIEDGGPVLFTQDRMTIDRKVFKLYKFRSMIVDAEKGTDQLMVSENDSRVTKTGKVIRSLRIDELPQFFNILIGDMSFVGPRPERLELVEEYSLAMPQFLYRYKVKAGLTGLAQVMGKYNTTPRDKLLFDLMYIEQFSLFNDIKILLKTVKIVFMKEATEGVSEGQASALDKKEEN